MKQIKPASFVLQSHSISRSAYIMPSSTRKLIFAAMHFAVPSSPQDINSPLYAEMSSQEILGVLGLKSGGSQYKLIKEAFKGAMKQVLEVETETGWKMFHWIKKAQYNSEIDTYFIDFSQDLTQYISDVKKQFTLFPLEAIGKLQGKYSMRIYELVMSMSGMAGKDGNKRNEWFYQVELSELRNLFKVGNQYPRTNNFRARVIDQPIEEINKADIGIRVTPEYIRRRKTLYAVKFKVRMVRTGDPKPVNLTTETIKENEELINAYPKKWKMLYDLHKSQGYMFNVDPETQEEMTKEVAIKELKEWVKKNKKNKTPE